MKLRRHFLTTTIKKETKLKHTNLCFIHFYILIIFILNIFIHKIYIHGLKVMQLTKRNRKLLFQCGMIQKYQFKCGSLFLASSWHQYHQAMHSFHNYIFIKNSNISPKNIYIFSFFSRIDSATSNKHYFQMIPMCLVG